MKTICVNSYIDCDNHWINHSYEFVEDIFLHFSRLICIIAFRHQHIIVCLQSIPVSSNVC